MVKRRDYLEELVEAARSVLLEIIHLLGEYRDDIVVVGGWVPELLLPQADEKHIGSVDVDLALDHRSMGEAGYKTILELLLSHGYRQGSEQPFIFFRTLVIGDREIEVEVDFLAGEYEGTGKKRRTQRVQDMRPRKARGVDLVFGLREMVTIRGRLPEGGDDTTEIRVASIPAFLVMKAMAMNTRLKEKDAWDICYCIRNYPGGADALIEEIRPFLGHGLVQEALNHLSRKFSSPLAVGPTHVVDFDEITDPEDRALGQRDAFERIQYLLNALAGDG
jgi:hypothetical protein